MSEKPKWDLEERVCKCGCGMKWKCLPTSPNYYASILHELGMVGYFGLFGNASAKDERNEAQLLMRVHVERKFY